VALDAAMPPVHVALEPSDVVLWQYVRPERRGVGQAWMGVEAMATGESRTPPEGDAWAWGEKAILPGFPPSRGVVRSACAL
jgi:hypothetical protein